MKQRTAETLPASTYIGSNIYKKSNELILSLSTPTLMTNKLLLISTMRAGWEEDGKLSARITGDELHKIFDRDKNSGSFYESIKKACYGKQNDKKTHNGTLMGFMVVMENKKDKSFSAHNLIMDADFRKGVLSVTFNPSMKDYIIDMKNNYTCLDANEMMSMSSIYSYRLLEIFRQNVSIQEWLMRQNEVDNAGKPYYIQYDFTHLKLMLGIIDGSSNKVLEVLQKRNKTYRDVEDFDQSSMKEFSNFRRNVLDVAKKELDEKASIRFEYHLVRSGRGGKTTAVDFYIYTNEKNCKKVKTEEREIKISEQNMDDMIDELRDMIDEKLPTKDLRQIVLATDGDLEKAKDAYRIAKEAGEIHNLTGFLLTAIRDRYQNTKKKNGTYDKMMQHTDEEYSEFFAKY